MGVTASRIHSNPSMDRLNRTLIWLFSRCNESRNLEKMDQLMLAKALHEAATHLRDQDVRMEIQSATKRAVSILSSRIGES